MTDLLTQQPPARITTAIDPADTRHADRFARPLPDSTRPRLAAGGPARA